MWATYSKALWQNHMIFHLCVVAFHQFTQSSLPTQGELACERARARAQGPVFLFPLLPLLRNIRTKVTRKTWDPEKPEFSCSFFSRIKIWKSSAWLFSIGITCLLSPLITLGSTAKWFWFPFLLWFCGLFGWKWWGKYLILQLYSTKDEKFVKVCLHSG